MIEQKYIDVIESLGWNILGDLNDTGVELQQASPAGEDFVFYTDTADFPNGVIEYARDFDPDEHVGDALITAQSGGRSWLLGDDLVTEDNLLDGFSFYDVILAVHCNCKTIDRNAIRTQVQEILSQRLEDMNYLLDRNIDKIAEEARKGRE